MKNEKSTLRKFTEGDLAYFRKAAAKAFWAARAAKNPLWQYNEGVEFGKFLAYRECAGNIKASLTYSKYNLMGRSIHINCIN